MPHRSSSSTHKGHSRRHNSATADMSIEQRLGSKVQIIGSCWAFLGELDRYHCVQPVRVMGDRLQQPTMQAHRWFYETLVGPIETDLHLHHTCENPGCVNPEHLVPLTPAEHNQEHARLRRQAS